MTRLRRTLAGWLRVLAGWIDVCPLGLLEASVRALTAEADATWPEASGEFKRHQVLARVKKEFPAAREREIGMAIEQAVQARA